MRSLIIGLIIIIIGGYFLYYYKDNKVDSKQKIFKTSVSPISTNDSIDIKASFKIITNGTTRTFTDTKYHNLSNDVYITSKEPNIINVKKENITWSNFFKTLPMSLDKNCLVTGTKQTFCTNENKKLYFFINNTEDPNALDKVISENDYLLIEYKQDEND